MVKKNRLLALTFFGILLSVFVAGFIAMTFALKHLETTYIELQLETSKRQAENMAKFIEVELEAGVPQEVVLERLQASVMGTDAEKGFLCMFDKSDAKLVCHPNQKMVGMKLPNTFKFKEIGVANDVLTSDFIRDTKGSGGIFNNEDGSADITYMTPVKGTDWVLSLHQNIKLVQDAVEKERKMFLLGSILVGLLIAILATLSARFISRRYENQIEKQNEELKTKNVEINQQKEEILSQKDEIYSQYDIVTHQKEQITSSIRYASRIQNAALPVYKEIGNYFSDSFIFFMPRDIVSGDFYWFAQKNEIGVFVAADCTGHGVPGAFMSMLGIAFLNEIVNKKLDNLDERKFTSGEILDELREKVITSLKQEDEDSISSDGMDLALCVVNKEIKEIQFSGANNLLVQISDGELTQIKGDRMPISTYYGKNEKFKSIIINYKENDSFYMASDGFIDQFGQDDKGKYLKRNFNAFLKSINDKPFDNQAELLRTEFDNWKGNTAQLDDVIVVGFRV